MIMPQDKTVNLRPEEEYIKLGQLLKFAGVLDRGSDEKGFLAANDVKVNGKAENRRGAKIRPGDEVIVGGSLTIKVCGSKS